MINFSSPKQLSVLLFGGEVKETVKEPVLNELGEPIQIKSGPNRGEIRTKNVEKTHYIKGLGLIPNDDWKNANGYSTDEKNLRSLLRTTKDQEQIELLELLLRLRGLQKLNSTYLEGFKKHIYPDSCIRGNIGHVTTQTGRTNSSNPNLQNLVN